MDPQFLDDIFNLGISKVLEEEWDAKYTTKDLKQISESFSEKVPDIIDSISQNIYTDLIKNQRSNLKNFRRVTKKFEKKHQKLWRDGIDLLESLIVISSEVGAGFNAKYRPDASKNNDYLFEALVKLQGRAVQVSFEILALLKAGYSDGAHARWRTLHEITVIMIFLNEKGTGCAERYLMHEHVSSHQELKLFQKYAEALGFEKEPDSVVKESEFTVETLCKKYGKKFSKENGWAFEYFKQSKERITFSDIEKSVDVDYMRPYYKIASYNVHAGAKGVQFRLSSNNHEQEVIPAGPSNFGLYDPARDTSLALVQATDTLLTSKENLQTLSVRKILEFYIDDIDKAFKKVNKRVS